jgi:hypothetical protein
MMANQDEKAQIRAQLETLARQVSDDWRQHLRSLRTALDLQISSIEGAFDDTDNSATIDAAVKRVSDAVAESAQHARKQAEATAAKALAAIEVELRARLSTETAANIMLRSALDEAKKEQKKLTTAIDTAQAKMLTLQTQLKTAQREAEANSMALAGAQQQVQALTAERTDLLQQVKTANAAKAAADAQWRQLEGVSQKLSSALSQMVREREPGDASVEEALARPVPAPAPAGAKPAPLKAVRATSAPASPTPAPAPAAPKKPLQFSDKARDAKRIRIRRGIDVVVDAVPGELVDLSLGGAQALLRQAVKPNQLVRMVVPTATGQLICKGRVVWVTFEQPGTSLSVYRTGVKFSDADPAAVETFMNDFCEKPSLQRQSSGDA